LIIQQSGKRTELSTHFDSDMVVLENGFLKANFSYLLWWRKQRYYIKRFLVETENKKNIIRDPNSQLKLCRQITVRVELIFPKVKEAITVDIEDFIAKDLRH
jgi:topoisomerase-4 subunit A